MTFAQRDYFDDIAGSFRARYAASPAFQQRRSLFLEVGRAALARVAPATLAQAVTQKPLCLDLGCGPGVIALALAGAQPGFRVLGVDSSSAMIAEAQALANGTDCEFRCGDLLGFLRGCEGLQQKPALILCSSVLEYLDDPAEVIRISARLLAPGGTLAISFPNLRSLLRRLEPLTQRLLPRRSRYLDKWRNRLALADYLALGGTAGLVPLEVRHFGFPARGRTLFEPLSARAQVGTLTLLSLGAPGQAAQQDKPQKRPLRVLINATSARLGGGITVLQHLLPALLAEDSGRNRYLVTALPEVAARIDPHHPRCELIVPPLARPGLRLVWEQLALPARAFGADVLFSPANIAVALAPIPQILMVQNAAPFDREVVARARGRGSAARLRILRGLGLASARVVRKVVFLSEHARSTIAPQMHLSPERTCCVNLGRDPHFAPSARARAAPLLERLGLGGSYLLTVSQLYFYKNLIELIEGFALALPRLAPGTLLAIAGAEPEPEYAAAVRAAIARLGLTQSVRLLGQVAYDDLPPLYAAAQLFVFPSTCESFPNILVEALASGAPTLASKLGPMPEIAGDGALYFDPYDPADIANKIVQLSVDEPLREALGKRGLERSAHYSWAQTARGLLSALEEAAG